MPANARVNRNHRRMAHLPPRRLHHGPFARGEPEHQRRTPTDVRLHCSRPTRASEVSEDRRPPVRGSAVPTCRHVVGVVAHVAARPGGRSSMAPQPACRLFCRRPNWGASTSPAKPGATPLGPKGPKLIGRREHRRRTHRPPCGDVNGLPMQATRSGPKPFGALRSRMRRIRPAL